MGKLPPSVNQHRKLTPYRLLRKALIYTYEMEIEQESQSAPAVTPPRLGMCQQSHAFVVFQLGATFDAESQAGNAPRSGGHRGQPPAASTRPATEGVDGIFRRIAEINDWTYHD